MAVLEIVTAPDPVLATRARDVRDDEFGDALMQLTSDMAETMYAAPGVGLAAPQVGDSRRIIVVDPGDKEDEGTTSHLYRMVNPTIVERSKKTIDWPETCLSVPDFEVMVRRNERIRVEWQHPKTGAKETAWFEGFEAVIIQHELDHLLGTILLDKVSGFRRSRYLRKVKKREKEASRQTVL